MRHTALIGGGIEFDCVLKSKRISKTDTLLKIGASDEARTRYLHLGKVALYQMSYTRNDKKDCNRNPAICQEVF